MKIRILDLFCGAGGAAKGYHDAFVEAGFEVDSVGIDIRPQKHYPYTFIQDDAFSYALAFGWSFDFIHASPPCQVHSVITPDKSKYVDLIPHTRFVLETLSKPYVIENVGGARKALRNPIMLCGAQFGLKVYRHRFFESNVYLMGMSHVPHRDNTPRAGHGLSDKGFISITSGGKSLKHGDADAKRRSDISDKDFVSLSDHFSVIDYCRKAMGIDWMNSAELFQAIPPAYTHFIGKQFVTYFQQRSSAFLEQWQWQSFVA